jgi:hypothetical protein
VRIKGLSATVTILFAVRQRVEVLASHMLPVFTFRPRPIGRSTAFSSLLLPPLLFAVALLSH